MHSSKWPWHHHSPNIRPPPTLPTRRHPHQAHSTPRSRPLPPILLPAGSMPLAPHQAIPSSRLPPHTPLQPARRPLQLTPRPQATPPQARLVTCSCRAAVPQTHFICVGASGSGCGVPGSFHDVSGCCSHADGLAGPSLPVRLPKKLLFQRDIEPPCWRGGPSALVSFVVCKSGSGTEWLCYMLC